LSSATKEARGRHRREVGDSRGAGPAAFRKREAVSGRLLVRSFAFANDLWHIAFELRRFLDHLEAGEAAAQRAATDQVTASSMSSA